MANNDSSPTVLRQYDAVLTKLRAAQSVAHLLSQDPQLEQILASAANHLWQLSTDAEAELDKLLAAYRAETMKDHRGRTKGQLAALKAFRDECTDLRIEPVPIGPLQTATIGAPVGVKIGPLETAKN